MSALAARSTLNSGPPSPSPVKLGGQADHLLSDPADPARPISAASPAPRDRRYTRAPNSDIISPRRTCRHA
jgi:hypothetical protein